MAIFRKGCGWQGGTWRFLLVSGGAARGVNDARGGVLQTSATVPESTHVLLCRNDLLDNDLLGCGVAQRGLAPFEFRRNNATLRAIGQDNSLCSRHDAGFRQIP